MGSASMMQLLEGYLKVTTDRQQIITSNIANIDTPGFHTRDVNFKSAMEQAVNESDDSQRGTAAVEVEGLPERPDGNNVNIDRESMLLGQTQLQYQLGVELIKGQFHDLLSAIKDGN
jgi:flagellar basal-body rod protein FlgB